MVIWVGLWAALVAGVVGYLIGRRHAERYSWSTALSLAHRSEDGTTRSGSSADIERALADLRLGVVVVGPAGKEVYRNQKAEQYATGRHADALVSAAADRVIEGALVGLSLEESVEVYGPPAKSFLVQASPTYERGVINGAVGVIDDVTEARYLDRVRSDFVANVSHELRTPVGALSVLAETIAQSDDPDVVDRLSERMQREAVRLSDTIDNLLTLSRVESGPIAEPETMDLRSVVAMATERTADATRQQQVQVLIEQRHDSPIMVDGDRSQLTSAVSNLIENGIKYSNAGGVVVVTLDIERAENKHDDLTLVERRATLTVVDSGIGIPTTDLDRIFERFYRVDSARSRKTGGTGLGLSIVRHAVLNHGGTIDVTSTEGRGSTFTVILPLSKTQSKLSGESGPSTESTDDEGNSEGTERQWTS